MLVLLTKNVIVICILDLKNKINKQLSDTRLQYAPVNPHSQLKSHSTNAHRHRESTITIDERTSTIDEAHLRTHIDNRQLSLVADGYQVH